MSYKRDKNSYYLMPANFGRSHTPRQRFDGTPYDRKDFKAWIYSVTFESDEKQLNDICPEGLEIVKPHVTVSMVFQENIDFLAGRGYTFIGVTIPTVFPSKKIYGDYMPVVWMDNPDTVITGREAMGFNKYYCDTVQSPRELENKIDINLSWFGHRFFEMRMSDKKKLSPIIVDSVNSTVPGPTDSQGFINHKYIPKAGEFEKAEVDQLVLVDYKRGRDMGVHFTEIYQCHGHVRFLPTAWEDMPLQANVIEGLRNLKNKGTVDAKIIRQHVLNDLTVNTIFHDYLKEEKDGE